MYVFKYFANEISTSSVLIIQISVLFFLLEWGSVGPMKFNRPDFNNTCTYNIFIRPKAKIKKEIRRVKFSVKNNLYFKFIN